MRPCKKRTGERKLFVLISFSFLISLTISCLWILYQTGVWHNRYDEKPFVLTNGFANNGKDFYVRQHGSYRILYNLIKARKQFSGNQSVTLVLHGEWTHIKNLSRMFYRWQGPISVTIFASGDDFERARFSLSNLLYCTSFGKSLRPYINVNFIMHEDFLSRSIPTTEEEFFRYRNCTEQIDYTQNFRTMKKLKYPSNMARNVGRQTAHTRYILELDMDTYPSLAIPRLFFEMLEAVKEVNPRKTVFVLPAFEIQFSFYIPLIRYELKEINQDFLEEYFDSTSLLKLPRLREWYEQKNKLNTVVFDKIKRTTPWLAYYISVNDYEPFYDENVITDDSKMDKYFHMNLLQSLDYTFYVVNVGFICLPLMPPYNFHTEMPNSNDTFNWKRNLNFLLNFM